MSLSKSTALLLLFALGAGLHVAAQPQETATVRFVPEIKRLIDGGRVFDDAHVEIFGFIGRDSPPKLAAALEEARHEASPPGSERR